MPLVKTAEWAKSAAPDLPKIVGAGDPPGTPDSGIFVCTLPGQNNLVLWWKCSVVVKCLKMPVFWRIFKWGSAKVKLKNRNWNVCSFFKTIVKSTK